MTEQAEKARIKAFLKAHPHTQPKPDGLYASASPFFKGRKRSVSDIKIMVKWLEDDIEELEALIDFLLAFATDKEAGACECL